MEFDIAWEYCIKEECRVANRESLLKEDDQALATHTIRRIQPNSHKKYIPQKKFQRKRENNQKKDYFKYQGYNYHKIGDLSREFPLENKRNKIYHSNLDEDEDE